MKHLKKRFAAGVFSLSIGLAGCFMSNAQGVVKSEGKTFYVIGVRSVHASSVKDRFRIDEATDSAGNLFSMQLGSSGPSSYYTPTAYQTPAGYVLLCNAYKQADNGTLSDRVVYSSDDFEDLETFYDQAKRYAYSDSVTPLTMDEFREVY